MMGALKEFSSNERHRIIIDSGAFTAWKANKPIQVDDYCRFIESLPFKPFRYFALDVIGDAHGTMRNYEIMIKRGFRPVPVFTRGEDPSVLDDYYKTSDLVAIGGLVGTYKNKGYVKWLMDKVASRPVHLLGFTDINFVRHYKPYSCDSSTLTMSRRFGSFAMFDEADGSWHKLAKKDFVKRPNEKITALIKSYGVDPIELAKNANWHGGTPPSYKVCTRSHIRASLNYDKRLDVKYFLALTTSMDVRELAKFYIEETEK